MGLTVLWCVVSAWRLFTQYLSFKRAIYQANKEISGVWAMEPGRCLHLHTITQLSIYEPVLACIFSVHTNYGLRMWINLHISCLMRQHSDPCSTSSKGYYRCLWLRGLSCSVLSNETSFCCFPFIVMVALLSVLTTNFKKIIVLAIPGRGVHKPRPSY